MNKRLTTTLALCVLAASIAGAGNTFTFTTGFPISNEILPGLPNQGALNSSGSWWPNDQYQNAFYSIQGQRRAIFFFEYTATPATSATLRLRRYTTPEFVTIGLADVTLDPYDVETVLSTRPSGANEPLNIALYDDLGDTNYGTYTFGFETGDPEETVDIPLNATALAALSDVNSPGVFMIGINLQNPVQGGGPFPTTNEAFNHPGEPFFVAELIVEFDSGIPVFDVIFDLGTQGTRTGGGPLYQCIEEGLAAVAPEFSVADFWVFTGWNVSFDNITSNLTVTAQFTADDDNDGIGNSSDLSGTGGATINEDVSGKTYEITNTDTGGTSVQLSFDAAEGAVNITATDVTSGVTLNNGTVLSAWSFDSDSTEPVTVTYDVGTDVALDNIQILYNAGTFAAADAPGVDTGWEAANVTNVTLVDGVLSFTVTDFSSYAVASIAVISEPAALGGLFGLAALLIARRRA